MATGGDSGKGEVFAREFDAKLEGRTSKLVDYSPNAPRVAAEAYRAVVGLLESQCNDAEAIDRLLNPSRNIYRLETLNVGVHAPLMRALQHANYTFAKKISHTADSQDQRHRMVPGSRPLLTLSDTREPDYITPMLLDRNPRAKEVYERAMHDAWTAKNELLDRGVPAEIALYVLPNAKSIRLSRAVRCSICCTNGRCERVSTRKKKFIARRWTNSISCARFTRNSRSTSARHAICARESQLRFARKARTSVA